MGTQGVHLAEAFLSVDCSSQSSTKHFFPQWPFFSGFVLIVDTGWQSCSVTYLLTLSYSSKINCHLYPQRVSLPSKKCRDMFSEAMLPIQSGADSPLLIVMAVWRTFFEFELSG